MGRTNYVMVRGGVYKKEDPTIIQQQHQYTRIPFSQWEKTVRGPSIKRPRIVYDKKAREEFLETVPFKDKPHVLAFIIKFIQMNKNTPEIEIQPVENSDETEDDSYTTTTEEI